MKATGYKNVMPGTLLAKYLTPMKDLNRSKEMVACRKAWMNNPDTLPRLHRQIEKIQREMKTWQESMSKASNETSRAKYYRLIVGAQHTLELKQDDLEHVEDKNYHLH